jgi:hypothetical protein
MSDTHKTWTEEIKVTSDNLLAEIEKLFHEGNVNHIVVQNQEGQTIFEIPVTIGIIGLVLAPLVAAIGAVAAFASHFTIVVTRCEPPVV